MIILPPEEKKSSPLAKWTFRILFTTCILIGMSLFGLSVLSGTSDAHRHGLEEAMSNIVRTKVQITKLNTFNFFPQFAIDMEGVNGNDVDGARSFEARQIKIAFALTDLLRKRGQIEDFQMEDLRLEAGVMGPQELMLSKVGIVSAASGKAPYVSIQGNYGGTPLQAGIDLTQLPATMRPSYKFSPGSPLHVTLGTLKLTGVVGENKDDYQDINDVRVSVDGEELMTGTIKIRPVEGNFALHFSFKMGSSSGLFVYVPSLSRQSLTFDTAELGDFTGEHPLWGKLISAWHEQVTRTGSQKKPAGASPDQISLQIKKLTGPVNGENIKGEFVYAAEHITGWWQGKMTQISSNNSKLPQSGEVDCALIKLLPQGDMWASETLLTEISPVVATGKFAINERTGKITYETTALADSVKLTPAEISAFTTYKEQLGLVANQVCPDVLSLSAPEAAVKP